MFKIDKSHVNLQSAQAVPANAARAGKAERRQGDRRAPVPHPDVTAAQEKARAIAEDAARQAQAEIDDARRQADEIRAEARRAGHAEGTEQAMQTLRQERQNDADQLADALAALGRARAELVDRFEGEFIDLCLATAKKIVNTAIDKDDEAFAAILKHALQHMKWEGEITVRVSNVIYERFFTSGSATFVLGDKSVTATILDDPSVKGNGCIVESGGESVNASVDSQVRYLALAFDRPQEQPL